MFGYSMIQLVRTHADKMDQPLREQILSLFKPLKYTPFVFHNSIEDIIRRGKKLPVIVEFEKDLYDKGCEELKGTIQNCPNSKVRQDFPRISCSSVDLTPNTLEELLTTCHGIKRIHSNSEVRALLDVAVQSANAKNVVRNNTVLTGKGVKIAIIDTGIYPHEDLKGRITDFVDFVNGRTDPYDDNGHGTHCAGAAAGNGSASSRKYRGPAPEADLVGVKVLNSIGSGSLESIMQGVEWCIQYNGQNPTDKIDILSMSLGATAQPYSNENRDPMVQMVEAAWQAGIVVCAAAGNEGPESQTIASPGISDQVITVGALDDRNTPSTKSDDVIAGFSSRGPTIYGVVKPDIVALGVNIVSLRSPNSYLDKFQRANRVGQAYFTLSGTSMATPICAGVVALMKQQNPSLQPPEIKKLLKNGADFWKGRDQNIYGVGYINAEKSIPKR
ncbi:S8 family peptidase [Metabacillus halosaccharovorans]|uniref:S8 family peptidase n=1 Tax=Metabacillus halosaccharovorans TaxID=930124 RepID=A0ABT3DFD6_9BACI|nr:S8 family peptidase [Metabacillus halosaccharovorans]MCV9885677.1 S8 family peptidase [Metabacillus halosaccharovorans]